MMRYDFQPIRDAMRRCRAAGLRVPIWWRDDDAIAPTAALTQLLEMAERVHVPVHLAVIPAHANKALAEAIAQRPAIPIVHGWSHENHSPEGQKSAEFGQRRTTADSDLNQSLQRANSLFKNDMLPIFVPPWNRIAPDYLPVLAMLGFRGVSTYGARTAALAAPGLVQINTHVDPIFWRGTRDLVAPESLIARTAAHLDARLKGNEDPDEPLGLLTHHLVHTKAVWDFSAAWLQEMTETGAHVAPDILEPDHEPT